MRSPSVATHAGDGPNAFSSCFHANSVLVARVGVAAERRREQREDRVAVGRVARRISSAAGSRRRAHGRPTRRLAVDAPRCGRPRARMSKRSPATRAAAAIAARRVGVAGDRLDRVGERLGSLRRDEQALHPVGHRLGDPADRGRRDRQPERERLHSATGQPLVVGRHREDVAGGEHPHRVVALAEQQHAVAEPELRRAARASPPRAGPGRPRRCGPATPRSSSTARRGEQVRVVLLAPGSWRSCRRRSRRARCRARRARRRGARAAARTSSSSTPCTTTSVRPCSRGQIVSCTSVDTARSASSSGYVSPFRIRVGVEKLGNVLCTV